MLEAVRVEPKAAPTVSDEVAKAADDAARHMLDEQTDIGTFWGSALPGRRAPLFSTSSQLGGWQRLRIGSANNVAYWKMRCEHDHDRKLTAWEKQLVERIASAEIFLSRFHGTHIWSAIEKHSKSVLRSYKQLLALQIQAEEATTWGDLNFLHNTDYIFFLGYFGRPPNMHGVTTYGWDRKKSDSPTEAGQRGIVLLGSATDYYEVGLSFTHDLINPALHLLERNKKLEVLTQKDDAIDASPWSEEGGKFELVPYNYGETRKWYREYPVHGVAPAKYTRRVFYVRRKRDGLLLDFDPTTTLFVGPDTRLGVAYYCLWAWRLMYGAPVLSDLERRDYDLWALMNDTVRPQLVLPGAMDLELIAQRRSQCKAEVRDVTTQPQRLAYVKENDVKDPIFAFGCPLGFLKMRSEPLILGTGLPELARHVLLRDGDVTLSWKGGAETQLRRAL